MEKLCIVSVALILGITTVCLTRAIGVTPSSSVILGFLVSLYGAWLGEQLYIKIHR